ncbi:hypothetical protein MP638_001177, partial [Amoeboaphelidium occidentale]
KMISSTYSIKPKITFISSVLFTSFTIYFVHWDQNQQRMEMKKGLIREKEDLERLERNKRELEEQQRLRKIYELRDTVK